jgi:hypothetical protein
MYGKQPQINYGQNISLENISLFYLNVVKIDEKQELFSTINSIERIDKLHNLFKRVEHLKENPSLSLNFFELEISGQANNQNTFAFFLVCGFIFLIILYRKGLLN